MSGHEANQARVISLRPTAPGSTPAPTAPPTPPVIKEPLLRDLVGDVLRRERLTQKRTLRDVAGTARISMPYLSEIERGRKEPSSEVLAAAAHALGLGLADVLCRAHSDLIRLDSTTRTSVALGSRRAEVRMSLRQGALALAA